MGAEGELSYKGGIEAILNNHEKFAKWKIRKYAYGKCVCVCMVGGEGAGGKQQRNEQGALCVSS